MIGLDPAPRLDGVVHAPELVDVAHEVDVGADGLTHDAHALDGGRHRGLAPALHLHLAKAHVAEAGPGLREIVNRMRAHEGAARIGRHAVAQSAKERAHGLAHGLAPDVPARDVDRRERQREDPAGARAGRSTPQLGADGLHLGGVVADDESGERVHRGLERRRQRAAEEGQGQADEALVGAQLERDELPRVRRRGKADNERVVGRGPQHTRGDVSDLHRWPRARLAISTVFFSMSKRRVSLVSTSPPVTRTKNVSSPYSMEWMSPAANATARPGSFKNSRCSVSSAYPG